MIYILHKCSTIFFPLNLRIFVCMCVFLREKIIRIFIIFQNKQLMNLKLYLKPSSLIVIVFNFIFIFFNRTYFWLWIAFSFAWNFNCCSFIGINIKWFTDKLWFFRLFFRTANKFTCNVSLENDECRLFQIFFRISTFSHN